MMDREQSCSRFRERADKRASLRDQAAGYTIIELLSAITVTTLLTGVIVTALISQGRFVETMSASVSQNQQVRSGLLLLGAEISDLSGGSVKVAGADSIVFRYPIAWGVMCGPKSAKSQKSSKKKKKKKKTEDFGLLYLDEYGPYLWESTPQGFAILQNGTWRYYDEPNWNKVKLKGGDKDAEKACLGQEKDDEYTAAKERFFKFEKMMKDYVVPAGVDTIPAKGAPFTTYVEIAYFFEDDPDGTGVLLYRETDRGAFEFVGPFAASAGFRYQLADGRQMNNVTGTDLRDIRRIRVRLPALRRKQGTWARADSLEVSPWIPLQNAR